jgi:hypothetical protein
MAINEKKIWLFSLFNEISLAEILARDVHSEKSELNIELIIFFFDFSRVKEKSSSQI